MDLGLEWDSRVVVGVYGIYGVGGGAMFRILKCMSHRTYSRMLFSFYFNVFIMYIIWNQSIK